MRHGDSFVFTPATNGSGAWPVKWSGGGHIPPQAEDHGGWVDVVSMAPPVARSGGPVEDMTLTMEFVKVDPNQAADSAMNAPTDAFIFDFF